ncbi:response regulator [Flavisolibacter ginsengisoli]|jgi:two-component system invasion response regulator UvrY|uniref:Two component transcriptional regulator, LuxR family n=1 Tax=Flavisolibacter ginsengisoli DSM 18119 TaxID=1121884 RepID=A0A1M4X6C0_9BACT|nr:response regulator transcription factor [Flavisolibacter ginsengisoli]SHE89021.1 two component transcriptional regulator, LuxR family [Flavisolibacter ginsengisoli DSM 18119]
MNSITILIVDDHTLIRETWSFILNADSRFNVIAACGSGEEAVELAKQFRPHIVLMDINLPGINGIEATALIRKYAPGTKIVAISLHTQPAFVQKIMQNGASGYVTKNSGRQEMVKAIEEIFFGKKYICNNIKEIIAEQMMFNDGQQKGIHSLTTREIEIISLIKKGDTSKEIAASLYLSTKTVEVHRYNILKKLKLKNSVSLVEYVNKNV